MANVHCSANGSNTSPYDTWAKAATSIATALAVMAAGDNLVLQYNAVPSADKALSADTNYAVPSGCSVMSASNDGGSAFTYRPMADDSDWIGSNSTNRSVTLYPATSGGTIGLYGLTLRTAGSTSDNLGFFAASQVGQIIADDLYFWNGNSSSSSRLNFGSPTSGQLACLYLKNPTFRFAHASQGIVVRSATHVTIVGGRVSSDGTTPTTLIQWNNAATQRIDITGLDASVMSTGCTLIDDAGTGLPQVYLRQVRRGASCALLATPTTTTRIGMEVWEYNCQVGTTLNVSGYHNLAGSVTNDTATYLTAGPSAQSWKIVTSTYCSELIPFETPWIDWYNTNTSSMTPRLEVLRVGTTTAFTDAQLWGEFTVRVTSGSVAPTLYSDRAAPRTAGSSQATGAGTGSWTFAGGSAWSGKLAPASALTPNAAGRLRARAVMTAANEAVYMHQQILAA